MGEILLSQVELPPIKDIIMKQLKENILVVKPPMNHLHLN